MVDPLKKKCIVLEPKRCKIEHTPLLIQMKFVCLFITPQIKILTLPLEIHNMLDAETSIGNMHFYDKYRQHQINKETTF